MTRNPLPAVRPLLRTLLRAMRSPALLLAATLGLASAGCAQEATQLFLVVESDLASKTDVDSVELTVTGPSGKSATASYLIGGGLPGQATTLPFRVGLVPGSDDDEALAVTATAYLGVDAVVSQSARSAFTPHELRLLVLRLDRACIGVTCPADQTCAAAACVAIDRDPRSLPPDGE